MYLKYLLNYPTSIKPVLNSTYNKVGISLFIITRSPRMHFKPHRLDPDKLDYFWKSFRIQLLQQGVLRVSKFSGSNVINLIFKPGGTWTIYGYHHRLNAAAEFDHYLLLPQMISQ
ncbi:hypothetical protein NPIL_168261 [Nephila pilipes]|uniref:Uncharacterized protein n=1 Tax=Nephila pilipes TaxID=299642 RepID=A0A8X6U2V6_NEPPI|nr:hypothetical protein NPIL_168261 [Nephila pilipes]